MTSKLRRSEMMGASQASPTSGDAQIRILNQNLEKLKQVLLYILTEVGSKPNIGETVLHKLLYFIDFDYYEKYEENLMGATYIKNHYGPTSVELGEIIGEMVADKEIEKINSSSYTHHMKKYLPLQNPNFRVLSAQEINHIDVVLARLSDKSAREISDYSHQDIPWLVAKEGKAIPYESVFYRDDEFSVRSYDDEF